MGDIDFDAMADRCYEAGRQAALVEGFPDDQRRAMQRRIKNQRRALKHLNMQVLSLNMLLDSYRAHEKITKSNAYRHAAQLAETFHYWPFGKRIGAYIRKWI